MWNYNNMDELYHYGILGMRWGVRRFQTKDGRLTPRGKKRKLSQDAKEAKALSKKKLYQMSNDEIKTLNKRKQLETDYRRLNKSTIAKGMAVVATAGTMAATYVTLRNNGKTLIEDGKKAFDALKNIKK